MLCFAQSKVETFLVVVALPLEYKTVVVSVLQYLLLLLPWRDLALSAFEVAWSAKALPICGAIFLTLIVWFSLSLWTSFSRKCCDVKA